MKNKIEQLKNKIVSELEEIKESDALKELEQKYLGRKGELTQFLKKIKDLDESERKEIGRIANIAKKDLVKKFQEVKRIINNDDNSNVKFDVTLPGSAWEKGSLHPLTQIRKKMEDYFAGQNFLILDGPELESDYYNFEALNIPEHHPARDMQDTFYVESPEPPNDPSASTGWSAKERQERPNLVMRTHTSPVQVRAMQKHGAPLRCVVPGRVFRNEATDANHDSNFYQLEGLMVDENISIANLTGILKGMLSYVFEQDVKVRLRPGYFPFVEPGLEVDMSCTICGGPGCPSCKHSGWLEMVGAGMVHPNVLKYGNIDPDKYNGFAFGIGIDRLAMMLYGVNDIRLFHQNDLRFLKQF